MQRAITLAERGVLPDTAIRLGMRRVIRSRLDALTRDGASDTLSDVALSRAIADETDTANRQHYDLPPEFFASVLGPRLKYSCAYWPPGVGDLGSAEQRMLELYADRASLKDGQRILDLGCGWGSFSLWAAERYPNSSVLAVSNSRLQGEYIDKRAADLGLDNIEVETADVNTFQPGRRFDRIVSIEMLEHVRNHRLLFSKMADWLAPDGLIFTHVFAHRDFAYLYEADGPANWMARTFFTGGVMPSRSLLPDAARPELDLDAEWWVPGTHYQRTCEAWLERLDGSLAAVRESLEPVYEREGVSEGVQRWRMFFMACAELFAFDGGREWGVAHQRFRHA